MGQRLWGWDPNIRIHWKAGDRSGYSCRAPGLASGSAGQGRRLKSSIHSSGSSWVKYGCLGFRPGNQTRLSCVFCMEGGFFYPLSHGGGSQFLGRVIRSLGSPRRREGSGILQEEERGNMDITICKMTNASAMHEAGLWDSPEGWIGEGGGRGVQDGSDNYTPMADSC